MITFTTSKFLLRVCYLLSFVSFLLFSCGESPPIIIGFSAPLEGRYSDLGVQGRNGAQLAIEDINGRGGLEGRQLVLLAEDDSKITQSPVEADKKLIGAGAVAIIGHMTSSLTMEAYSHAVSENIVMVSPTTSTPLLSGKKDIFFRVMPANTEWASSLGAYAAENDIKNVGVISDSNNSAFAGPFVASFANELLIKGGNIISDHEFSSRDFENTKEIMDSIKFDRTDAVLIVASARDAIPILRDIQKKKATMKILIAPWAYTKELIKLGGQSVDGIITAMDYYEDNPSRVYQLFKSRYFQRFGQDPSFAASYGYDAVIALAEALGTTGGKRQGLEEALVELQNLQGAIGTISMDEFGDVARPTFILTIANGKMVRVKK